MRSSVRSKIPIFTTPVPSLQGKDPSRVLGVSFLALVLANCLLSFLPLSTPEKTWIFLLGLALPLGALIQVLPGRQGPMGMDLFPRTPPWLLTSLGALALFLRFYKLGSLSHWPLVDEGIGGHYAVRLANHWDWELLQGTSQTPRLYSWTQALLFKVLPPSLGSLWLCPALWSALILPMAWYASNRALRPSLALLTTTVAAFGFWPLILGRYSVQAITLVFWEFLALFLLTKVVRPGNPGKRTPDLILLGIALGLGFYTYFSWALVFLWIGLALYGSRSSGRGLLLIPIPLSLLAALPLAGAFAEGYRGYFNHLGGTDLQGFGRERLALALAYGKDLFWGSGSARFDYGPLWGGFLNPVLGALFFLGGACLIKGPAPRITRWVLAGIFLFSLPAFLTNDHETMRMVQFIPLLCFLCALGAQTLASGFSTKARPFLLLGLLLASLGMDCFHLFHVYPNRWNKDPGYYGHHKSIEYFRAYDLLKTTGEAQGPGYILLDLLEDPYDQTLSLASHRFNGIWDPRLDPKAIHWAAFLANVHDGPDLQRAFPGARWTWLSKGLRRKDGGLILGIVPRDGVNGPRLDHWLEADRSLEALTDLVLDLGVDPDQGPFLGLLAKAYPYFKDDPILERRFWRISALHRCAGGDLQGALADYGRALSQGRPEAQLYNERGSILYRMGRIQEARQDFRSACALPLDLTDAKKNLEALSPEKRP